MTILEASRQLVDELKTIYDEGEAIAIGHVIIQHLTDSKPIDRISQKEKKITAAQAEQLKQYTRRLLAHEPAQYVVNEAWFGGLKFYVDKNVLIPRPETEELIEWVISDCKFPIDKLSILDIGTGSGCIPIVLKRKLRKAQVYGCDISEGALQVAQKNASTLGAEVNFLQLDFLDKSKTESLPSFDIIISNPPYVPEKDKRQMLPNVLNYEPHTALFAPDNDNLVFYTAIADFGGKHLNKNGIIYVEIHKDFGKKISDLFKSKGYRTEIRKDMQGNERMLKAVVK